MADKKSGKKTLLTSVILSSSGPLVIGLGLMMGRSSTQIADFVRRSIELVAIILSYIVYCVTTKEDGVDDDKKKKYERNTNIFVSIAMVISGFIMIALALSSSSEDTGNVIPGLAIGMFGLIANSIFWIKYSKLGKESGNAILTVQSRLYLAKTFVDLSVVIALGVVLLAKDQMVAHYFDLIGTICVSTYLIFTGVKSFISEIWCQKNTNQ